MRDRHLLLLDMITNAYERIESNPEHKEYVEQQLSKIEEWEDEINSLNLGSKDKSYCNQYLISMYSVINQNWEVRKACQF